MLAPTFRAVRISFSNPDEAIDWEAMSSKKTEAGVDYIVEYSKTRDEKYLIVKEGKEPTWFHIKRLPAAFLSCFVETMAQDTLKWHQCLRAALHSVQGHDAEGLDVLPEGSKGKYVASSFNYGVSFVPDEYIQDIADKFGSETLQEMGMIAYTFSRLPKGKTGPFGWWGGGAQSR